MCSPISAYVPPPDISIDISEAPSNSSAITSVQDKGPIKQEANEGPITPPKGSNQNQVTRDVYPPVSIRLGEEGTVTLKVTISAEGTITAASVAKSSGHPRLDEAAINIAKSKFKYTPASQGGKAVEFTATIPVVFRLS